MAPTQPNRAPESIPVLLALIDGPFTEHDAAAATGLGLAKIRRRLRAWTQAHFVDANQTAGVPTFTVAADAAETATAALSERRERELHVRLAERLRAAGAGSYVLAARHFRQGAGTDAAVDAYLAAAEYAEQLGDARAAYEVLREATDAFALTRVTRELFERCARLAIWIGDTNTAVRQLSLIRALYRASGDRLGDASACVELARAYASARDYGAAGALADRAVEIATDAAAAAILAASRLIQARLALAAGDIDLARRRIIDALGATFPDMRAAVDECIAWVELFTTGKPAEETIERVRSQYALSGDWDGRRRTLLLGAAALRLDGRLRDALAMLQSPEPGSSPGLAHGLTVCASIAMLRDAGRARDALALVAPARAYCADAGRTAWAASVFPLALDCADDALVTACEPELLSGTVLMHGNGELLATCAVALYRFIARYDAVAADAFLDRACGLVAAGPHNDGLFWIDALGCGSPAVHGHLSTALARLAARGTRIDRLASQLIASALARAHVPAREDADRASGVAALREMGFRRAARVAEHIDGRTTDRNADILKLIEAGCTNAEIAERLGVSKRTVTNRISSLLKRRGFKSRWQLTGSEPDRIAALTAR